MKKRCWLFGLSLGLSLCLSACQPAPIKKAEQLMEKARYAQAQQFLENYLSGDVTDALLRARASILQAEATFYNEGPLAALPLLQQLREDNNKDLPNLQARLRERFEALDQHIAGTKEQTETVHPWFEERIQWSNTLRKKGKSLEETAETSESPLIQSLARWELARLAPERYATLLKDFPDSAFRAAWYQGYFDYLKTDQEDQAKNVLVDWKNELKKDSPLRSQVLLLQAQLLTDKQPRAALNYYRDYLKNSDDYVNGRAAIYAVRTTFGDKLTRGDHAFLAEAAYQRYMYQTAYNELSQLNAGNAKDLLKQGEYALKAKYYSQANQHFEDLRQRYPGTVEAGLASVYLAQAQRRRKAYGAAMNQLQAVYMAYGSQPEVKAAALWEEGIIYDLQNNDAKRAQVYHELVKVNPEFEDAMPALWYAIWHDFLQDDYARVIETLEKNAPHYQEHELKSRFEYWLARAYEQTESFDKAKALYESLSQNPLMDYYTHRARARLQVIKKGGDDQYATLPYQGLSLSTEQSPLPKTSYAHAFDQAVKGNENAFSPLMELHYLGQYVPFMQLAEHHPEPRIQVLHGLLMQQQKRYYEAVTRYRYLAAKDDAYLPAAFPLAYFETLEKEAKKYEMNPFLPAGLIWQESQYNPTIKSWVGATGLMQIMPATGAQIAKDYPIEGEFSLTNPMDNIKMGVWYLDSRHKVFDGNSLLAVASYNAGAGPVNRWLKDFGHLPLDALAESITYPETRGYVKRVFTSYWIYQHLYGK